MRPLYIFDLDGTLALTEHRQHILGDLRDPNRWKRYFEACVDDRPNQPVIDTMHRLMCFVEMWIWSGRSEEVRPETIRWLTAHTNLTTREAEAILRMRQVGDFTPDEELKARWFDDLPPGDRQRLVAVFDDRDKVVDMWRAKGVACFQVAPGDF